MKYNFDLDMQSDNSNSLILREVKPNSNVLEFGCAHGRMTKYLKENLNCSVTIVEKDFSAGKEASKFATKSYIGVFGNIEQYYWKDQNPSIKYDYIIFADVLEHLYDPWAILLEVKYHLKDDGYILISVPNIGHNAVIIDLLNDKFDYREIGLLDNSHIRFFTEKSLKEMVEKVGLKVHKVMNAKNIVENTEFKNSYSDVPEDVANFLKNRPNGDIYQFVWSLSK